MLGIQGLRLQGLVLRGRIQGSGLPGGSWVVISGDISPQIRVISIVPLLIIPHL